VSNIKQEAVTTNEPISDSFGEFLFSGLVALLFLGGLAVSAITGYGFGIVVLSAASGATFYFALQKAKLVRLPNRRLSQNALFDDLPVALIEVEIDGKLRRMNGSARALLGNAGCVGDSIFSLLEGMGRSLPDRLGDALKGFGQGRPEMARCNHKNEEVFLQVSLSRVVRANATRILVTLSDATEFKTLEAQFVQSQKMQAVGQLAGGVAHDFNNILTAISGHADLLLQRRDLDSPDYSDLDQIRQNTNRAAALVRQLLAFSRKQTLQPRSLKLDDTLSELSHLLNRLLGEKVSLRTEHGQNLKPVRVDERQFEQVIMNLVVNARDAMPDGGTVLIRTRNVSLIQELRRDRAIVSPGEYVVVEVRDTGEGIPPDTRAKIFEPFFTTKKPGEGTGLGLSTVYGIVKQTGGFVFVDSETGGGTSFTIYLPVNEEPEVVELTQEVSQPQDLTGRGQILLVEDEAPVRAFASRALTLRGYTVTEAESGEKALEILNKSAFRFDVFVSDVVMPGKDGPTWVREALQKWPGTRVVFMSGYAEDSFGKGKPDIPQADFLAKPFSLVELAHKIKMQIDTNSTKKLHVDA